MISALVLASTVVISNPPISVQLSCSVAPQKEESTPKTDTVGGVLQTPLKIFTSQPRLSLIADRNLEREQPALTNLMISDSFPKTGLTIPEISENTKNSVFVQLGGRNVFGRSAYFFGDLLLTEVYCPDFRDSANATTCSLSFPALQIFGVQRPIPENASRIRVKLFRNGNLLTRELTPELMGEGETRKSYLEKYTRKSNGKALDVSDEAPKGTLKGFFLYSSYQFEGPSKESSEKGDGSFELKYGLPQAAYRIPILSRQNPSHPFAKTPDAYFVEIEVTLSDKPSYSEWAIVNVGAEDYIDPSEIEFQPK